MNGGDCDYNSKSICLKESNIPVDGRDSVSNYKFKILNIINTYIIYM